MLIIPKLEKNKKLYELDMNNEDFIKFNNIVKFNPGLSTDKYIKLMNFYNFSHEELEYAFRLFNTYKCTFNKVCGPFLYDDQLKIWYLHQNKLENIIDIESIILENSKLKRENLELKKKLGKFINKNNL
jgi:hypothetical protein